MSNLRYKTFKSSEEFEKWQGENLVQIFNCSPIMQSAEVSITNNSGAQAEMSIGLFVMYKDIDEDENQATEDTLG